MRPELRSGRESFAGRRLILALAIALTGCATQHSVGAHVVAPVISPVIAPAIRAHSPRPPPTAAAPSTDEKSRAPLATVIDFAEEATSAAATEPGLDIVSAGLPRVKWKPLLDPKKRFGAAAPPAPASEPEPEDEVSPDAPASR